MGTGSSPARCDYPLGYHPRREDQRCLELWGILLSSLPSGWRN